MQNIVIKSTGALLIVYTGVLLGRKKGNDEMRRIGILDDMICFLNTVRTELHYRGERTEKILSDAQKNVHLKVLPLYFSDLPENGTFYEKMSLSLSRTENEIREITQAEERNLFRSALEMLGIHPSGEQEQYLTGAAAQLSVLLEQAKPSALQQCRLYRTMGVSLGCAAALLLL